MRTCYTPHGSSLPSNTRKPLQLRMGCAGKKAYFRPGEDGAAPNISDEEAW